MHTLSPAPLHLFIALIAGLAWSTVSAAPGGGGGGASPTSLACTTSQTGNAVINEIQSQDNFIEIYFKQPADLSNWSLWISGSGPSPVQIKLGQGNCYANGTATKDNASSGATSTTWPAGTFIACDSSVTLPSKGEILLVDKQTTLSGNNATVIDALNYGNPAQDTWSVASACRTIYDAHNAGNKDIARRPDGTGALADNDDESTKGTSNDGGGSSPTTAPTGFNCVEEGANPSTGHLYTKLAGTNFSFDIVALKADGSIETTYASDANKSVTVELVDGSGSTACTSRTTRVSWPDQTFMSGNAGRITASAASVSTAYSNLRCRVSDGTVTGCSTDSFAIRPTALTDVSSINANADDAGTSATATPTIKAGSSFALSVTAIAGYNGTPAINSGKLEAHSGASRTGTVSGTFAAANTTDGIASGATFTYDETGYFRFQAQGVNDTTFTAIDSSNSDCTLDYSNTLVGGKYGCYFGNTANTVYFGRFIPDHFAITAGTLTEACPTAFSYFGEDGFSSLFTLKAENASNAVTQNYAGSFARLGLTSWTDLTSVTGLRFASTGLPAGSTLSASTTAPTGSWSSGQASVTAKHKVSRPTALTAQTSVVVTTTPVDSDGVTMSATAVSPAAHLRYGRLRVSNKYGATSPLNMPIEAQYWSGNSWVKNSDDNCTSINGNNVKLGSPTGWSVTAPGTLSNGTGVIALTRTGAASTSVCVDLGADNGTTCSATSSADQSWLQSKWPGGTGYDNDPSATATLGIYAPETKKTIHIRELY